MKPTNVVPVTLAHPDNHPIVIGLHENAAHKRFDLEVLIGNFGNYILNKEYPVFSCGLGVIV